MACLEITAFYPISHNMTPFGYLQHIIQHIIQSRERSDVFMFYTILIIIGCLLVGLVTLHFINFKEWLVWACTEAEKQLGAGTGELKLKFAYNLAIKTFPVLAKLIPYQLFSILIKKALEKMKSMIESNEKIANILSTKKEGGQ
ncbi:MAG TPA: hypothetical protein VHP81_11520 [Lachnospiraceae bacterium]|nr:hypothetical protein [Lachnospiraceae bacterium]